jgi:hypothetical protein
MPATQEKKTEHISHTVINTRVEKWSEKLGTKKGKTVDVMGQSI